MKAFCAMLAVALFAAPAWGQLPPAQPETPELRAATKRVTEKLVAETPGGSEVFSVLEDGSVKHLQSGMVCPAAFPNVGFSRLVIFPSSEKGADVACDYIRGNVNGGAYAKLTIYATKASPDTTLDSAFAGYQREIAAAYKKFQVLGPALRAEDKSGKLPPSRSEQYLVNFNQRDLTSDLIVAVNAGWVIEVRSTYEDGPDIVSVDKDSAQAAAVRVWDRRVATVAYVNVVQSVGK
jgi:hypothetical protein